MSSFQTVLLVFPHLMITSRKSLGLAQLVNHCLLLLLPVPTSLPVLPLHNRRLLKRLLPVKGLVLPLHLRRLLKWLLPL
jgi:hypothetical protein